MKKIYGILLIALLSLCLVFALSACGDEESTDSTVKKCLDDEHEFLAWEIVEEAYCNTLKKPHLRYLRTCSTAKI